ncbi:von Willebrand factor A domain-containing protein 3A isoform X2 [Trichomycterus rosablanca]|uniref:von Willebrand factor A domain-containing protein 3A isoform X2 n=1 Tax=Trichomycterus rosablanca TaxID=2290929 RepID=UPI002F3553A0
MAQSNVPFSSVRPSSCRSPVNTHDTSLFKNRPRPDRCVSSVEIQKKGDTATKHTQTWNIKMLQNQKEDDSNEWISSEEWLKWRSLESCGLSLSHLLSLCSTTTGSESEDSIRPELEIDSETLTEFEMQLYQVIEMYHSRIRWLTQGSRKMFGVVTGSRVAVLIDSSDVSCSEERLADLQHNLLLLVEEQLCKKKQLHFMSCGTDVTSLWEEPRQVTRQRLQEVQECVLRLIPSGGCNLLQALERVQSHTQINSLLIVLSSCPDLPEELLLSYMAEVVDATQLSVHAVSYNTRSPSVIEMVKNIAKVTGGRYHLFSALLGVVDSSSDLELLWAEIKAARDVLHYIQKMRHGRFENLLVFVVSEVKPSNPEISTDLDSLSLCDVNSHNNGGDLCIQSPSPLPSTSAEWLKTHSLKAKKLGLYQVLAPNVYSPLESFVPILGKKVHSKVHEKAMVQFKWHDGTVKNVNVDLSLLLRYQKQLLEAEHVLEDRLMWLNSKGSRQIWGTVCEQRVLVILDMSKMSVHYQLHIQHAVRLLLEEQLPNTHSFNIIVTGSDVKLWKEQMVPPTHENLQDAWQWIQGLECEGEQDTLTALKHAAETLLHSDSSLTRGVYLFTIGMLEQEMLALSSYRSEFCSNPDLLVHVCFFTMVDKSLQSQRSLQVTQAEAAQFLRNLAHMTNGRFHWITDTGIVESDDIIALIGEMEKAVDDWQKCCELMDYLVQQSSSSDAEDAATQECQSPALYHKSRTQKQKLPSPRETRLSLARLVVLFSQNRTEAKNSTTWRPNSAKAVIPPVSDGLEPARPVRFAKPKEVKISQSMFFLENGSLGSVFNTYLKPKCVKKFSNTVSLPKHEDVLSTKQWLKQFGIRNLKLDLHKLVSGPECTHRKKMVPAIYKSVSAKYCAIFPSVQINGHVRHLFLSAGELKQYLIQTEAALQRYTQRMQWLLSGSRCVFGCVLEKEVCIVLDVSGSMAPCIPKLQKELASLIWEQLHANRVRFSMVAFSEELRVWQDKLLEASEESCKDAVTWLGQLNTHGGTSILNALQMACGFGESVGVYLISDGCWDCSCSLVLKELEGLTAGKHITIHTVTLDCHDREFLKSLAHKTGGRFHQTPSCADTAKTVDGEDAALPGFEGDDLKRLKNEIEKLRMFHKQAKSFRESLLAKNPEASRSLK